MFFFHIYIYSNNHDNTYYLKLIIMNLDVIIVIIQIVITMIIMIIQIMIILIIHNMTLAFSLHPIRQETQALARRLDGLDERLWARTSGCLPRAPGAPGAPGMCPIFLGDFDGISRYDSGMNMVDVLGLSWDISMAYGIS